jgi:phage repressor protein C with HTH and peptisase S24 domain
MAQTFKDRLKILMKEDRPYTWSKKVGIDKGLFQYYWQKGKIPTYENLLKIQRFAGCSLDWLLTGRSVAFEKLEDLPMVTEKGAKYGARNLKLASTISQLKEIYSRKTDKDIEAIEYFIDAVISKKTS